MRTLTFTLALLAVVLFGLFRMGGPSRSEADAQALLAAKQAYVTAQALFADSGGAKADIMALTGLGLTIPGDIDLEIVDGKPYSLLITSRHVKGSLIYSIDAGGNISTLPRGRLARFMAALRGQPENRRVNYGKVAVVSHYSDPGPATRMMARNAYSTARYFFISHPGARLKKSDLGYLGNDDRRDGIVIDILDGTQDGLRLRARHPGSGAVWEADARGRLTSPAQVDIADSAKSAWRPPSRDKIRTEGDQEARETAAKVFELSRRYLSEYSPEAGLRLDALTRAYPSYSIPPDVTVEVLDPKPETLRLRTRHRDGAKAFEVGPDGIVKERPLPKKSEEA